ncbi:MAG: BamA/TamA family outer membrane protein [Bacteroidetes bacterium]|jgi:NTE family protein|nr:BamA/TamA family outer membrane protein [Bacteroidota bacterium]
MSFCRTFSFILAILLFSLPQDYLSANPVSATAPDDSLRVGLVLSGGGAKGIAHIGVLKKLEEAGVRIDYITGTSMGSVIGALYSIGYTSDQLIELAKSRNWEELFTEKPSRRYISNYERLFDDRTIVSFPIRERSLDLPVGIIKGQNIYTFLSRYTWPAHGTKKFSDFPIPFATVATEIETGKAKVFRSGYLPDAIRASISIPSLMRPHTVNDTTYIDGGLSNNLPVDEAINMGSDYIISVNVASPLMPKDSLKAFTEVLNQVVSYRINEKIESQIEKSDLYIRPEKTNAFEIIDFDRVDELIQIGYDEASVHTEELRKIAEAQGSEPKERRGIGNYGALPFNRVIINGNNLVSDEFIMSELEIEEGFQLTPDFIDDKISQLYSTQLFDLITYRIQPDESYYYNLHINVEENTSDIFKVGVRYETQTEASILLASQFRNFLFNNSEFRMDLRLGNEIRAMADLLRYGGLGSRLGIRSSLLFESENVDQFTDGDRTASFNFNHLRMELSLGNYLSSNNLFRIGVRRDVLNHTNKINDELIVATETDHQSLFFRFTRDKLQRRSFPNSGARIMADVAHSGDISLSKINYFTAGGLAESFIPVSDEITIRGLLFGGFSSGDELPWNSFYSLNRQDPVYGFVRFGGLNRYEMTSRNIQMISTGIQIEPIYHRFINFDYYAGRFLPTWNLNRDNITHGASITVGALTILGPVELILSSGSENSLLAEIQIGYKF